MANGKKTDDLVFNLMTTVVDETLVDIEQLSLEEKKQQGLKEKPDIRKRVNKNWVGYDIIPQVSDELSKEGIKIRPTPALLAGMSRGRPFTLGNTIYIDMGKYRKMYISESKKSGEKEAREMVKRSITGIVKDELPHVAQYREAGSIPAFLKEYATQALHSQGPSVLEKGGPTDWINKLQRNLYRQEGSLEAFHHIDPMEKNRLLKSIGIDFQSDMWYPEKLASL